MTLLGSRPMPLLVHFWLSSAQGPAPKRPSQQVAAAQLHFSSNSSTRTSTPACLLCTFGLSPILFSHAAWSGFSYLLHTNFGQTALPCRPQWAPSAPSERLKDLDGLQQTSTNDQWTSVMYSGQALPHAPSPLQPQPTPEITSAWPPLPRVPCCTSPSLVQLPRHDVYVQDNTSCGPPAL